MMNNTPEPKADIGEVMTDLAYAMNFGGEYSYSYEGARIVIRTYDDNGVLSDPIGYLKIEDPIINHLSIKEK